MINAVSRETKAKLDAYVQLVTKWNPKVNLVSKASILDIWNRHIEDSVQIARLSAQTSHWVDLGSGGGFPGLVLAVWKAEFRPEMKVTLVESDQRKCVFLRTAARELSLDVTIRAERIESCDPLNATTLSARALAPLNKLLSYTAVHLHPEGTAIFPKGASWKEELQSACQEWSFNHEVVKSETDPEAAIIVIKDVKKR